MSVALWVGDNARTVGSGDFLRAFFSTVSYLLEPEGWGSRYPELMRKLYIGELHAEYATKAYADLKDIRERLRAFRSDQVVWDIDHQDVLPPWGNVISSHITDLSTYFITSEGRDFITVLLESLQELQEEGGTLYIE